MITLSDDIPLQKQVDYKRIKCGICKSDVKIPVFHPFMNSELGNGGDYLLDYDNLIIKAMAEQIKYNSLLINSLLEALHNQDFQSTNKNNKR